MTVFSMVVTTRTMINVIFYDKIKNRISIQCFMLRKMGN